MPIQSCLRNLILSRLSAADFALLDPQLEPVKFGRGTKLIEQDEPFRYAYFLERGIASIIAETSAGAIVETGLIGREGFLFPPLILGADRACRSVVMQLADNAYRIPAAILLAAAETSANLRRTLLLFVHVHAVQITSTALSNAVHCSETRLARWLLMYHDRTDADEMMMTHDLIALMMAVRRPTVTNALHILEGLRLIRSERGMIVMRDRAALETFVGDAYGVPEAEYRRLLSRDLR